ncbi:TDT family transporter [Oceanivirga salmonicida]|uniref:TDT family transporter n=1 Tax=Oceanivirga salmonicida TaxID=1769291 RepID=UPI00082BDAC7|nr:TDT family transporter [Oceanivirga salmonicida]
MNKIIEFIKNYEIPTGGLILAIFSLNMLFEKYKLIYYPLFFITLILYLIFILKLILKRIAIFDELNSVVIESVFPTIFMATMVLSTYIKSYNFEIARIIWYVAIVSHFLYILRFSWKYLRNFSIENVFPSWFIVYIGIAAASVTSHSLNNIILGQYIFYTALTFYTILLPIVCYRMFIVKNVSIKNKPTFGVFAAPASLLLAGYLSAFTVKESIIIYVLFTLSTLFFSIVLVNLPKLLSLDFTTSFSAYTFPTVITTIALNKLNIYYNETNNILNLLFKFELTITFLIVIYVLARYLKYFYNKFKTITFLEIDNKNIINKI